MTGTAATRAKTVIACPRGCGRRTNRGSDACQGCREGWPAQGSIRCCADCGKPLWRALQAMRCRACTTRMAHRNGLFANVVRADRWTPEEDALLRAMAGRYSAGQIGQKIGRSRDAVQTRAYHLEVYLQTDDWTLNRIRQLFRTSEKTIRQYWIRPGLLPARKLPAGDHCLKGEWRIREADLERFVLEYPWAYDALRMVPESHRLAQLAKRVQRRDPWLTTYEVAPLLGLVPQVVARWCQVGVIPSKRRHVGAGAGVHGQFVIRQADLPSAQMELERRREARLRARVEAAAGARLQRRAAA